MALAPACVPFPPRTNSMLIPFFCMTQAFKSELAIPGPGIHGAHEKKYVHACISEAFLGVGLSVVLQRILCTTSKQNNNTYLNTVYNVSSSSSSTRNTQQTSTFQMDILYNFSRQLRDHTRHQQKGNFHQFKYVKKRNQS